MNEHERAFTLSRRRLLQLGGTAAAGVTMPGLLTACGGGEAETATVLRVSQTASVNTLDPQKQGSMIDMSVLVNIFDCLTRHTADGRLAGALAERWEPVDDTRWRFSLRRGVKFHNGEPFNAEVVKFSIERLLRPATKSPIVELSNVEKVTLVDEHTVDIATKGSDPLLPTKVSLFGGVMVPPKYLAEVGDAEFAQKPVGTGPFRFQSWKRDAELRLVRNVAYWRGKPRVRDIAFRPVPNPATALASLRAGELDLVTGLTPDSLSQVKGDTSIRTVASPGIRTFWVALDTLAHGPLARREVRQALNHGVDVKELIDTLLSGAATRSATNVPRHSFGYAPSVSPYEYDPDRARALLAEAGYPNGFSVELTAQSSDSDIVQAISGQWQKIGVTAKVRQLDAGTFEQGLEVSRSKPLGPMFFVGGTAWMLDASQSADSFIRSDERLSRFTNSRADELVTIGQTSLDENRRRGALAELQGVLKQEAPFVFLYTAKNVYAMRSAVQWKPDLLGLLWMGDAAMRSS